MRWSSALLILVSLSLLAWIQHRTPVYLLDFLGAAFMFWVTPILVRRKTLHLARRQYQESLSKGATGEHTLELLQEGLIERTSIKETKTIWSGIERVESSEKHTFIYTGALTAYVIPHESITEGNLQEFLQDVEQQLAFSERLPA